MWPAMCSHNQWFCLQVSDVNFVHLFTELFHKDNFSLVIIHLHVIGICCPGGKEENHRS